MKDIKLHTWYFKEEFYSDKSNRKFLYYFFEDNPEDFSLSCYYITKITYDDETSTLRVEDDHNAYNDNLETLVPCDNPEEIYNEFVNSYQKLFKK